MLCVVYALLIIVSLGVIVRRNTVWRDDMTLYTRTLQTNPDAAVIRSNLGALYFDTRQYDRALKEWQLALQQKPDNVVIMNALGTLYTRLGRYAEADAMFQQAIAAKPLWGDSHFNDALLLQKIGHPTEALAEFKIGVSLSPLSGPAHHRYGEALSQYGRLDEAAIQLKDAVELEGSLQDMRGLAEVYLLQGRNAQADPLLRRITSQFPYDSSAHVLLGRVLEQGGKRNEARSNYQEWLASDPDNVEAKAAVLRLNRN